MISSNKHASLLGAPADQLEVDERRGDVLVVPHGTPLYSQDTLTVLSCNLLAPLYVRPVDTRTGKVQEFAAFEWCRDEDLAWEGAGGRRARLVELLTGSAADVLMLQEVQFEAVSGDPTAPSEGAAVAASASSSASSSVEDEGSVGDKTAKRPGEESSAVPPVAGGGSSDHPGSSGKKKNKKRRNAGELSTSGKREEDANAASSEVFDLPLFLREFATTQGYDYQIPSQKELKQMAERNERVLLSKSPVGNAVLWRRDRVERCDEGGAEEGAEKINKKKSSKKDDTEKNPNSTTVVGVLLKIGGKKLFVVSLHCDATSEEKRVKQILKCLTRARGLTARDVIFAGDMNSEMLLGSCVGAVLVDGGAPDRSSLTDGSKNFCTGSEDPADSTTATRQLHDKKQADAQQTGGAPSNEHLARECSAALRLEPPGAAPSPEQLEDWAKLRAEALATVSRVRTPLLRAPLGPTRAALDPTGLEPRTPNGEKPMCSWALDHILFSCNRSLCLQKIWATLEKDEKTKCETGLPNAKCPSDHLPVCAQFRILTEAEVLVDGGGQPQAEKKLLLQRVKSLREKQQLAEEKLSAELESAEQNLESEKLSAELESGAGETTSKKKGGGQKKPSAEAIAFKREARERQRRLREKQVAEREGLVADLTVAQADWLEDALLAAAAAGENTSTAEMDLLWGKNVGGKTNKKEGALLCLEDWVQLGL